MTATHAPIWRAGPSGVAHAAFRTSTRALCGVRLTDERDAYPVERKCVGCVGIVSGPGTLDMALAEAERVLTNAVVTFRGARPLTSNRRTP